MILAEIRARRERFAFTPGEVGRLARLLPQRVLDIEAGAPCTVHELTALGDALAFDPAGFVRGERLDDARRSAARFRSPEGVRELPPTDARLLARAAELARIGAYLADRLGVPPSRIHDLRELRRVGSENEPWREGYELGEAVRLRLTPERGPLVSVQAFLEELGIHVAFVEFAAAGIHAASIREPGSVPIILLNTRARRVQNALTRRPILAHELCHLLYDGGEQDLLTVVSRREAGMALEQRAGGFAPSFIAPPPWVKVAKGSSPLALVRQIALDWGFTYEGAAWHAKNLGHVSVAKARDLTQQRGPRETNFEPLVVRQPVPDLHLDVEASRLAKGLISDWTARAFNEGLISAGRAREILAFQ